jgi:hypothetical protein
LNYANQELRAKEVTLIEINLFYNKQAPRNQACSATPHISPPPPTAFPYVITIPFMRVPIDANSSDVALINPVCTAKFL